MNSNLLLVTILLLKFANGFPSSTDWYRFSFLLKHAYFHLPVIQITFLIGRERCVISTVLEVATPEKFPTCQYYKCHNGKTD